MHYRVYIVHTNNNSKDAKTEYYPIVDKNKINKKIDELNKTVSPDIDTHNCLEWQLNHKKITMTVIDNITNKTIETACLSLLK